MKSADLPSRVSEPKRYRPAIPDSVALAVALRQGISCACGCGRHIYKASDMQKDHHPPLALREYNPKTRKYTPDANDPNFLQFLLLEHAKDKSFGSKATTAGSDIANIKKASRLAKKQAAFEAVMLAKTFGKPMTGEEE